MEDLSYPSWPHDPNPVWRRQPIPNSHFCRCLKVTAQPKRVRSSDGSPVLENRAAHPVVCIRVNDTGSHLEATETFKGRQTPPFPPCNNSRWNCPVVNLPWAQVSIAPFTEKAPGAERDQQQCWSWAGAGAGAGLPVPRAGPLLPYSHPGEHMVPGAHLAAREQLYIHVPGPFL
jgi:hypothetical protein